MVKVSQENSIPFGFVIGKRLCFKNLDEYKGYDIAFRKVTGSKASFWSRIGKRVDPLHKRKWVHFNYRNQRGEIKAAEVNVSSLAKHLLMKKSTIRKCASFGGLEELVCEKISQIKAEEVLKGNTISHSDDSLLYSNSIFPISEEDGFSLSSKSMKMPVCYDLLGSEEGSQSNVDVEKDFSIEEIEFLQSISLTQDEFVWIQDYVKEHRQSWELSHRNVVYLRPNETGLSRTIFWIRNRGCFVQLKGDSKQEFYESICHRVGISFSEFTKIKKVVDQHKCIWANNIGFLSFDGQEHGLSCKIGYIPKKGLFLKNQDGEWICAEYRRKDPFLVGFGSYKRVYDVFNLDTNEILTIGSAGRLENSSLNLIRGEKGISDAEIYALNTLDHPNIQKGFAFQYESKTIDPVTERPIIKRAIISPLANAGTLKSRMNSLTLSEKVQIAIEILETIIYMHTNQEKSDGTTSWVHFDLKPSNILLHRDDSGYLHPIICDLGFAGPVEQRRKFQYGTLKFMSPELIIPFHYGETGIHTDIWALGVSFFKMFKGKHPIKLKRFNYTTLFRTFNHPDQFEKALNDQLTSSPIDRMLLGMLQQRPSKRFTATQCLRVMKKFQNELNRVST